MIITGWEKETFSSLILYNFLESLTFIQNPVRFKIENLNNEIKKEMLYVYDKTGNHCLIA